MIMFVALCELKTHTYTVRCVAAVFCLIGTVWGFRGVIRQVKVILTL